MPILTVFRSDALLLPVSNFVCARAPQFAQIIARTLPATIVYEDDELVNPSRLRTVPVVAEGMR